MEPCENHPPEASKRLQTYRVLPMPLKSHPFVDGSWRLSEGNLQLQSWDLYPKIYPKSLTSIYWGGKCLAFIKIKLTKYVKMSAGLLVGLFWEKKTQSNLHTWKIWVWKNTTFFATAAFPGVFWPLCFSDTTFLAEVSCPVDTNVHTKVQVMLVRRCKSSVLVMQKGYFCLGCNDCCFP